VDQGHVQVVNPCELDFRNHVGVVEDRGMDNRKWEICHGHRRFRVNRFCFKGWDNLTIPSFKTETIHSQTTESKLTKTKTGTTKSSLYSISCVSVANCLPITLSQTIPLLETDNFVYQFYGTEKPQDHRSPDIVTVKIKRVFIFVDY
jgi:hypothetical protein